MGSITEKVSIDKSTGKSKTQFRAYVRRTGCVSKSKVFKKEREARDWLRKNDSDASLSRVLGGRRFSELLDDFMEAPATKGTRFWNAIHLDFWRTELGRVKASQISRDDINAARARLLNAKARRGIPGGSVETNKKLSQGTVNRYLASLSSVFNYALDRGIIEAHPMKGGKVKKLEEGQGRRRILNAKEEEALLAAAATSAWSMLPLFLRLCLTTAARKSEVLKLRWEQIQLDDQIAMLGKTRNGRPRALPLVADVCQALDAAKKVRPPHSDFVFFNPRNPTKPFNPAAVWKKCRADAGLLNDREDPLDRVVLHSMRHTAVTRMLTGGANLAQAAVVSGHQTLAMLKRCEHLAAADAVALAEKHSGGQH
jgi:integrase